MIGKTVKHYEIIGKLGEGGMGVVYKAMDTRLERVTALKFLPPEFALDDVQKKRFIQEARAASSIDHPNIGAIYEIDETEDGNFFIAMAFYDGESLRTIIGRGPLPIDQVLSLSAQIARGLSKAHQHDIIHRDLKPANVLVTSDGFAKIIDFGLAKLVHGMQLTRTQTSLGTIAYMSPEQTRGEPVGPETDLWALGVIMYQMVAGEPPFSGDYEASVMYAIVNERPRSLRSFLSDVPPDLERIIMRALQKDKRDRYQHAEEMLKDITDLEEGLRQPHAPASRSSSLVLPLSLAMQKRSNRWIAAGGLIVLLLAAAWLLTRPLSRESPASPIVKYAAVLPFANLGDQENEYYADGLTEDINAGISNLPQVLAIARTSTIKYKGSNASERAIAGELGVRFLLRGQFQASPARLKLRVWLYDDEQGKQIWTESYDMSRDQILGIKEAIIARVARELDIDPAMMKRTRQITSPEAYESYLHGSYYRRTLNKDDNALAMSFFSEALRKDSNYLPALVSLAGTEVEQHVQGWDRNEKLRSDAERLCDRALRIDSAHAEALATLGMIEDCRGRRQDALKLLTRAADTDKNNVAALTTMAKICLFEINEPVKAVMYLRQLQSIAPLDWLVVFDLGVAYGQIKNYAEAIRAFRRAKDLNPRHEWPPYSLGYAFERIGRTDSAIIYYRDALERNPTNHLTYEALSSILLALNRSADAESIMLAGSKYLPGDHRILYNLGVAYLLGGKKSLARQTFARGQQLIERQIERNPLAAENYADAGLFHARLGQSAAALADLGKTLSLDSTHEEVLLKVVRIYAVLGQKSPMLKWYRQVKAMNPEYDLAYLTTALDFERYRKDAELLAVAGEQ